MAKKINRKMLLADMNAGMDKAALMNKYDLSDTQFDSAMRKISDPTSLSGRQFSKGTDSEIKAQRASRCPACGAPISGALTECPKCGIIFAKYNIAEEPFKEDAKKVQLPDLLKGETVKVDERSVVVWIGGLIGVAVVIAVLFIFFRPWPQSSRSSSSEPKSITTKSPSETVVDTDLEPPDATEDLSPEAPAGSPTSSKTEPSSEIIDEPEGSTSQSAVAIPPSESITAEDGAAVPTVERRATQSPAEVGVMLDGLGQGMTQSFDRAVKQWNSDDFRRFADRARQKLDEASVEGLPESIREAGENLIQQLRSESPATAVEAFKRIVSLIRPKLDELTPESKTNFIKSAQEIKRDIDSSITR
ncbi:MAG: hypothetical protein ACLQPD_18210 [Desulfomonilaceae bacterium]